MAKNRTTTDVVELQNNLQVQQKDGGTIYLIDKALSVKNNRIEKIAGYDIDIDNPTSWDLRPHALNLGRLTSVEDVKNYLSSKFITRYEV